MGTPGKATDQATRSLLLWLRDRGFSVSECARRSNVSRPTATKIIEEELAKRGDDPPRVDSDL